MENYSVQETENSPLIELNASNNTIKFEGDSRPEDVQKFFNPVLDWLDNYGEAIANGTTINCDFKFEYFNSSSAKYIMDIIVQLGEMTEKDGVKLNVNWHYDEMDEDMLDAGEEFQDMLEIPFNFIVMDDD